jgi:hypothetical protein
MSMPAKPACFVAFSRARASSTGDRRVKSEDRCPLGSQEIRRAGDSLSKESKKKKGKKREETSPDLVTSC